MATDYLLFVHGVNVRESPRNEQLRNYVYADRLFALIAEKVQAQDPKRRLKKVPLYWGDVNRDSLSELRASLQGASVWNNLWFRDFRQNQLIPFAGDAALYISRHVGSLAVEQLAQQAIAGLQDYQPSDRLHLVTHSWGTVILFDVLFANRWLQAEVPESGRRSVDLIRRAIFGLPPEQSAGICLGSIHTMGSPIALFSLITITGQNHEEGSSHDLSSGFDGLLSHLERRLPWCNFIHPGDPVAWPLEKVIHQLIDHKSGVVMIEDVLTPGSGFLNLVGQLFQQSIVSIINGGNAHSSYWQSEKVAARISQIILET
ncbi:MAG: hypothetical protein HC886_03015 [Leptolyngbyaceae cyanobacterium SM1_1_3]|nr:hypothetical protein [Leptolyngbyaceae cyanobacterium SM1_1_3]NJN04401.1 hypothetical protein [Leptolyngbyaceae cyanobacterium RM1_1_2]NJO11927.1 hypothetical protein [Leptolyngbyaceae cyanobacterium SL_1_1]